MFYMRLHQVGLVLKHYAPGVKIQDRDGLEVRTGGQDLSQEDAAAVLSEIMAGNAVAQVERRRR